jgi:hypothetical protein
MRFSSCLNRTTAAKKIKANFGGGGGVGVKNCMVIELECVR